LLLPTTTEHPTLTEIQVDPFSINRRMGTYTNFCNLLDMAAVAIPGVPTTTGTPFGVMVVVPAFNDQIAVDIAGRLTGTTPTLLTENGVDLAIFAADLRSRSLHRQLEQLGARYAGPITKSEQGAPVQGELFRISEAGLGRFLAALPLPMALTRVELENGRNAIGFTVTDGAAATSHP
jgi:allophanate hydrolase